MPGIKYKGIEISNALKLAEYETEIIQVNISYYYNYYY